MIMLLPILAAIGLCEYLERKTDEPENSRNDNRPRRGGRGNRRTGASRNSRKQLTEPAEPEKPEERLQEDAICENGSGGGGDAVRNQQNPAAESHLRLSEETPAPEPASTQEQE